MGLIQNIANIALKPSVAIGNFITGLFGVKAKSTSEQLSTTTAGKVLGSAIAATGAGLLVATGTAGKVASVAIKTPIKSAAIVLGTATILQSEKLTKAVTDLPKQTATLSTNVADLIDNPSIANAEKAIKESPIAAAVIGAGLAATIGGGIGLVANTLATKENTAATLGSVAASPTTSNSQNLTTSPALNKAGSNLSEKVTATDENYPISTPYTTITTGVKRHRKAKVDRSQSIRQNVQVVVNSNNIRYLNRRILN